MKDLSEDEIKGLRGELTLAEWDDIGDDLFEKGYVGIDPLRNGPRQSHYVLTPAGIAKAKELQQ